MKKTLSISLVLTALCSVLVSCKTSQPMFAGAATAGWALLGLGLVLLVIVLKKFI